MVATLLAGDLILSRRAADGSAITVIETQTGPAGFDDLQLTLELLDGGSRTVHVQCRHRQRFAKSDARFTKLLEQAAAVVASGEIAFVTEQRRLAIIVDRSSPGHASMKQLCGLARTSGDFDRFVEVIERHGGEVRSRWGYCREAAGYMEEELLHSVLRSLEVRSVELISGEARDSRDFIDRLADAWSPQDHLRAQNLVNALFRLLSEMGQVAGIVDMGFLEARLGSLLPATLAAETRRERLKRRRAAGHRRTVRRLTAIGLDDDEAEVLATQVLDAPPNITNSEPVTVISGLMGVGKSTQLERLHRAAIDEALKNPDAPIPIRVKAAEIGNASLQRALSTHFEGFGDPSRVGVHLVIDGLDEAGVQISELNSRIASMQADWPNSNVLLGTRPQESPNGVEGVIVEPLTVEDAQSLMEAVEPGVTKLEWFRQELAEVLRRPLFTIRFALDCREDRGIRIDQGRLVASVGEQALRDLGDTTDEVFDLLVRLACRVVDSGGRPARPSDLDASPARIAQLSRLRIVQTVNGMLSFQLAALTEWFASDALRRDPVMLAHSVSSPLSAHRWRNVFVQALRQGSAEQIDTLMSTLLTHVPATASWVQHEAYTPGYFGESAPPVTSAEEAGARVRKAATAWLESWPSLVDLCCENGRLPPLGVALRGQLLKTAWLFGTDATPEEVALIPFDELTYGKALRDGRTHNPLAGITTRGLARGEDWPWVWVRDEFRGVIEHFLANRTILADIEPCWPELAWDFAREIADEHAEVAPAPILRSDLESVIASHRSSRPTGDVHIGSGSGWSLIEAETFVADLARLGKDKITSPWPTPSRRGPTGGARWTTEHLLTRLEQATKTALDVYEAIVLRHLPSMAHELQTYQLLPGRIVGELTPADPAQGRDGEPRFRWQIEPLPDGSENQARWSVADVNRMSPRDELEHRRSAVQAMRGDIADRIPYRTHFGEPAIFSPTPAGSLALKLLWSDLAAFEWVSGAAPLYWSACSARPRYN